MANVRQEGSDVPLMACYESNASVSIILCFKALRYYYCTDNNKRTRQLAIEIFSVLEDITKDIVVTLIIGGANRYRALDKSYSVPVNQINHSGGD